MDTLKIAVSPFVLVWSVVRDEPVRVQWTRSVELSSNQSEMTKAFCPHGRQIVFIGVNVEGAAIHEGRRVRP